MKSPPLHATAYGLIWVAFLSLCPHAARSADRPDHVVFGYIPDYRDTVVDPAHLPLKALTHLARAFLRPQVDGSLTTENNYFNPALETAARAAGVKLIMSVGGASRSPDPWKSIAANPAFAANFIDTIDRLYREHQYDGLDIDWEPPPVTDEDGAAYARLIRTLRQRFPGKLLTITVSGKRYALEHLPLADILPNVDLVNAMFYDYSASWTGVATFSSNLNRDPAARTAFSVNEGLHILLDEFHVPPEKLVMGTTFWGYRFRVDALGQGFAKDGRGLADDLEYERLADLPAAGRYVRRRSDAAGADYLLRTGGGCVITYKTPRSIREKCDRAKQLKLAGVMIWGTGADAGAGTTPLLSAIAESFGMPPLPVLRRLLEDDVARLSHAAVSPNQSIEALQANDRALRAKRAEAEDERWMSNPPAAH